MTSAAALAGAEKFFAKGKPDNYKVVIPMTGSGLKR
jgi:threonine synthase